MLIVKEPKINIQCKRISDDVKVQPYRRSGDVNVNRNNFITAPYYA